MAKKKDNTLLYAGIAAAALLLFKKKDSGMAGVGAIYEKKYNIYDVTTYPKKLVASYDNLTWFNKALKQWGYQYPIDENEYIRRWNYGGRKMELDIFDWNII